MRLKAKVCLFWGVWQEELPYLTGSVHLAYQTSVAGGNGQQRGGQAGPDETWVLPYLKKQKYKQADIHTHKHTNKHK